MGFVEKYKNFFQYGFMVLMIVLASYVIHSETKDIKIENLQSLAAGLSFSNKLEITVAGLVAFAFVTCYDFVFASYFKLKIPKQELFKIGWISQSFNNFIGFGGITGGAIRKKMYEENGTDSKTSWKITLGVVMVDFMGLLVLAVPSIGGLVQVRQYVYIPILCMLFLVIPFFLFGDKLPMKAFKNENSPLAYFDLPVKFKLVAWSTIEWLVAALFFTYTVKIYQPEVSWSVGILVYVIGTIVGVLSMVPGGFGTFEGTCLLLFQLMGFQTPNLVLSLLIGRIVYTILPWLIGFLLLCAEYMGNFFEETGDVNFSKILSDILAAGVFLSGLVLLMSVATPGILTRMHILQHIFPKMVIIISTKITVSLGILLIILSRGIRLRVKKVHHVTTVVLILAALTCLLKGLDYEEAVFMLVITIGLLLTHDNFQNPNIPLKFKSVAAVFSTGMVLLAGYVGIYNHSHRIAFFSGSNRYSLAYLQTHWVDVVLMAMVAVVIGVLIQFTNRKYHVFRENTAEDDEKFSSFMQKYQGNEYSHLYYMNDKNVFYNQAGTVLFLYRPYKNHILVLGDPIGNPDDFEDAIDELLIWAEKKDMLVSFYQISKNYLADFIEEGFHFLKLGESALVDLESFTLAGKANRALRNTYNKMNEERLTFEVVKPPFSAEFFEEIRQISDEWLNGRSDMQFSLGGFKESYLRQTPIFVIYDENGSIQAFANLFPEEAQTLSIDLMRHRKSAPKGTMDFLFISIMNWAKENNYAYFDLGPAPLSNVGNKLYSDKKEKLVKLTYQYGNKIYGFTGLRSYKQKYHPTWSSVYLAYKNDGDLLNILLALVAITYNKD